MKYITGLLGVLVACSAAWAAPETMEIYATLSAPIASFWEIKTEGCNPVSMPSGSQLNLGFVSASGDSSAVSSTGGTVNLKGNKPLSITKLRMEKGSSFQVGGNAKWLVSTIKLAPTGTANFGGGLIVNQLSLDPNNKLTANKQLTVSSALRLGSNTITPIGEFSTINTNNGNSCSSGDFCFSGSSGPGTASWSKVNCSINERNTSYCNPNKLLVGG